MKHTIKRTLALLVALLLALSAPALAEDQPSPADDAPISSAPVDAAIDESEETLPDAEDPGPALSPDAPEPVIPADAAESDKAAREDPDATPDGKANDADGEDAAAPAEADVAEGPDLELSEASGADDGAIPGDDAGADAALTDTLDPVSDFAVSAQDDGDALLDAYVQQMIDDSLGLPAAMPLFEAGATLTGMDRIVYDLLKPEIARVANGERTDTVFVITDEMLRNKGVDLGPWTAASLGVSAIVVNNSITGAAKSAVQAITAFSIDAVNNALLADCPFELYWYNKTAGVGTYIPEMGLNAFKNGKEYSLKYSSSFSITLSMHVSGDYMAASGDYAVNADKVTVARRAIENAATVVRNSSGSALDRLSAYKAAICERVRYNDSAAKNPTPYGDPWQLIYVFDGDPDTTVVCEGYSKAFKYLFDLSGFSDAYDCLLAIGTINGGAHMWNIVRMENGRNYLVDVTNCDSGSIGAPDRLFMAWGPSGSVDGGYAFTVNGKNVAYVYSDKTRATFSDDQLTLSDIAYSAVRSAVTVRPGIVGGTVSANPTEALPGEAVSLTVTPDAGYELVSGSLQYSYDDGAAHTTALGDSRSFFMPAAPVTVDAGFQPIPVAMDPSELTTAQKPAALHSSYTGGAQALLTPPAELPEGYEQVLYSLNDGASWSDAVPTAAEPGDYTVRVKYVGDARHADFEAEPVAAGIRRVDNTPAPETPAAAPAADTGAPAAEQEPAILTISAPKNVKAPVLVGKVYRIDAGGQAGRGFKSSNKKVASVTGDGLVTPKKPGRARITFKVGRKKRVVTLTVTNPTIPKRVTVSASGPLAGKKGGTVQLTAALPEGTTSAIKWTSSNKKVATVNGDGLVTFKKPGKATITATCVRGGKKARVKVRVSR